MTTIQKEAVTIRHCQHDGTLLEEKVHHRNVYRPKSGRPYIRVTGGKRHLDSDNPPLVIYRPLYRPISAPFDGSFDATIGRALRSLPPGSTVKVVPLP